MVLNIKNLYAPVAQKHTLFKEVSLFEDGKIIELFLTTVNFLKEIMQEKFFLGEDVDEEEVIKDSDERVLHFEEEKNYYALLFALLRLTKLFEHILIKKYIYLTQGKNNDNFSFEEALVLFKKEKIILSDTEEESVYLLQHIANLLSHDFLYEENGESGFSLLSDDQYMTLEIDNAFLLSLINCAEGIVKRINSL